MGLDRKDAAVLAVVLHDQSLASGAVGLDKVRQLIGSGQLNEATQAAMSLPAESGNRQEAIKEVEAARARLDHLGGGRRGGEYYEAGRSRATRFDGR